jgi:hypothetical protein
MRLLTLFALLATLAATAAAAGAQADPGRNLEAVLRPAAETPDRGFGLIKFRQPKDESTIIDLDVWVRDLLPDHTYTVQRATDTTLNDVCTGANWTMPPLGSITTDEQGAGRAALTRPLPATLIGSELDIHFRLVDPAAPDVAVLQSDCYQFTVSQ